MTFGQVIYMRSDIHILPYLVFVYTSINWFDYVYVRDYGEK